MFTQSIIIHTMISPFLYTKLSQRAQNLTLLSAASMPGCVLCDFVRHGTGNSSHWAHLYEVLQNSGYRWKGIKVRVVICVFREFVQLFDQQIQPG